MMKRVDCPCGKTFFIEHKRDAGQLQCDDCLDYLQNVGQVVAHAEQSSFQLPTDTFERPTRWNPAEGAGGGLL